MTTIYSKISKRQLQNVQFLDYIYPSFPKERVMKDLIETALDDEHIDMVICLLRLDKRLLDHQLSDNTTCKDRLMQLNEYHYVLSKLS